MPLRSLIMELENLSQDYTEHQKNLVNLQEKFVHWLQEQEPAEPSQRKPTIKEEGQVESKKAKADVHDTASCQATSVVRNLKHPKRLPGLYMSELFRYVTVPMVNACSKLLSAPPELGKKRIAWTCSCGLRVTDDYIELKPGAVDALQRRLNRMSRTCASGTSVKSSSASTGGGDTAGEISLESSQTACSSEPDQNAEQQRSQPFQFTRDCEVGPSQHRSTSGHSSEQDEPNAMHLILGYPNLRLATRVRQPDTSDFTSDRQFFQSLQKQYLSFRGGFMRRLFSLHSLREVRFVQFKLWKAGIAEIRKLDDIPPESLCRLKGPGKQQNDAYTYQPVPPETIPPLGSETIKHIMDHCGDNADAADANMLELFPRKLFDELKVGRPLNHTCSTRLFPPANPPAALSLVPKKAPRLDGVYSSSRVSLEYVCFSLASYV